jgi:hypothetical protein
MTKTFKTFAQPEVAFFKLSTGMYYIVLVDVTSKGYTKKVPQLINMAGAGFCRFAYAFFKELLEHNLILKTHVMEGGAVYVPAKCCLVDSDNELILLFSKKKKPFDNNKACRDKKPWACNPFQNPLP